MSVFAAKQYECACVCVYNVRKLGQVNRRDEVHKRLRDTKHKTQADRRLKVSGRLLYTPLCVCNTSEARRDVSEASQLI